MNESLTLSVPEAAQLLGVGKNALYQMIHDGVVPHLKFGRNIRIPRRALEEWLNTRASAVSGL